MEMAHDFTADKAATQPATEPVFFHPDREPARIRPLKALHHFRELIKDKENTEHVFHIFQSLPRPGFLKDAENYMASDKGRTIRAAEPHLPDLLDNHDLLRTMPEGSVAHAYCDFMEKEGLSAAGLEAEFDKFMPRRFGDQVEWYANRQRDTHDLLHVLTGYGRDALGEQCVLAFTYGQNPAFANLFIAYAGGWNMKKTVKSDAPVFKAIRQAQKMGKACPRVSECDITAFLAMPLDEARRSMNIEAPTHYREAHARFKAAGIDPYDLLA